MYMADAIKNFQFHCEFEKNLSKKTIQAYKIDLVQFQKYNNKNVTVKEFDKYKIKVYIQSLYKQNYKAKTIKRKMAVIKTLFTYLEFEEFILINPFRKIQIQIKEPQILPKTIELQNIRKLFKYIYKIKINHKSSESYSYKMLIRDIAVLEILFSTGLRVSEVSNIKYYDIDLNTGNIKVLGKGNKERIIQICNIEVKTILREYMSLFNKDIYKNEWFFINKQGKKLAEHSIAIMINKYKTKANINQHLTPHMFRHSFATMLLEEGVDIRYIQGMLGHSSISTTQIYTKINMKHQRKLLSTKHPRKNFKFII